MLAYLLWITICLLESYSKMIRKIILVLDWAEVKNKNKYNFRSIE